jgi:hypothetical protein
MPLSRNLITTESSELESDWLLITSLPRHSSWSGVDTRQDHDETLLRAATASTSVDKREINTLSADCVCRFQCVIIVCHWLSKWLPWVKLRDSAVGRFYVGSVECDSGPVNQAESGNNILKPVMYGVL